MPARPAPTTRRAALTAATGLAGLAGMTLAGCTSDPPSRQSDPDSTSVPPADADQVLADRVVERLQTALGAVVSAGDSSASLARELAGLQRLHVAHLATLGRSPSAVASGPAPGRREVLAAEARLQKFLVTAAVNAESGTLAQLLAAMSAGVAQHLAVLG